MRSFGTLTGSLAVTAGFLMWAGTARAEEVLAPPPTVEEVQAAPTAAPPAQAPTTVVTPTQEAAPPVPAAPPAGGMVQGPIYYNGPVWVVPAQPGFAPPLPPPPVYAQPEYRYRPRIASCCGPSLAQLRAMAAARRRAIPRGPSFSVGLRFTTMGTNQQIFGQDLNLMGGGLQLRFRNQGHWGFETAFDVLHANINNGAFVRNSFPWTASAMLYLFRNRPENHFNIYAIAGFGVGADDVQLYQGTDQERRQQFLEVQGHAGGGVELRLGHLLLTADLRAIGLALDDSTPAGTYYQGVSGGPIPSTSVGYKVNAGAAMTF